MGRLGGNRKFGRCDPSEDRPTFAPARPHDEAPDTARSFTGKVIFAGLWSFIAANDECADGQ